LLICRNNNNNNNEGNLQKEKPKYFLFPIYQIKDFNSILKQNNFFAVLYAKA
jgi:hypothetical protein